MFSMIMKKKMKHKTRIKETKEKIKKDKLLQI